MDIGVVTHGAFDVTVGPLVDAWGFGPDKRMVAPSAEALAEILPIIGSDKIEISEAGLTKAHPDLSIDLSAIAKGYAVDLIVDRLQGIGANNVLMEVGGEIVARGKSPSGHVWRLGIETPSATGREVFEVVGLSDEAMATSGDYRNFYEVDGARVSHLIDPRTAQPIAHRLASVTVITERCSTADAWATALSVLGEDEGLKLAEAQGLKAYFIVRDADGTFSTRSTSTFQSLK
jgi:thiamine biosynthesis lipoprotein